MGMSLSLETLVKTLIKLLFLAFKQNNVPDILILQQYIPGGKQVQRK